jgi:hypothetical protein
MPSSLSRCAPCVCKRKSQGITLTSDVEEMTLPNSRGPSHGGITLTSDMEEMTLLNSRGPSHVSMVVRYYNVEKTAT